MTSVNKTMSPKGGQDGKKEDVLPKQTTAATVAGGKGEGEVNQMQGLFFDLLACLAGGDHPALPQGFKPKPMTGFCAILDAFNDHNKLHEAGSGIIHEVSSSNEKMTTGSSTERLGSSGSDHKIFDSASSEVPNPNSASSLNEAMNSFSSFGQTPEFQHHPNSFLSVGMNPSPPVSSANMGANLAQPANEGYYHQHHATPVSNFAPTPVSSFDPIPLSYSSMSPTPNLPPYSSMGQCSDVFSTVDQGQQPFSSFGGPNPICSGMPDQQQSGNFPNSFQTMNPTSAHYLVPPNPHMKPTTPMEDYTRRESSAVESNPENPSESDIPPQTSSSSRETTASDEPLVPQSRQADESQPHCNYVAAGTMDDEGIRKEMVEDQRGTASPSSCNECEDFEDAISEIDQVTGTERLKEDQRAIDSDNFEDANDESLSYALKVDENHNWIVDTSDETAATAAAVLSKNASGPPVNLEGNENVSTFITEVGPPLSASQCSMSSTKFPRDITEIEMELTKYSDQIRELEKVLKENLTIPSYQSPQSSSPTAGSTKRLNASLMSPGPASPSSSTARGIEANKCDANSRKLIEEGGFIKSFASGMMSPSSALEMMYDAESIGSRSPCQPASTYLSTYQSCTSLASSYYNPNATMINSILKDVGAAGEMTVERTSSVYMDCLNNAEEESSDSSNPIMKEYKPIMKKTDESGTPKSETKRSVKIFDERDENNGNHDISNQGGGGGVTTDEEFKDCSEHSRSRSRRSSSRSKRRKERRRRRNRSRKHQSSSSSSPDSAATSHLWTSAEASEVDDEHEAQQND